MQFILLGYDGTDERALERRMAAREAHVKIQKELYDQGKTLYAAGILSDDGKMIGSMIIADFPSRTDLEEHWLKKEPYILGNVWKKVEINRAQTAPFIGKK
jgi:uncharacterized protein